MSPLRRPVRSLGLRRRPSFPRRKLRWQASFVGTGELGPESSTRITLWTQQDLTAAGLMNPTIMRIRGELLVVLSPFGFGGDPAPPLQGDQTQLYWGIGLQDGITGQPGNGYEDPFNHSYTNDWMWWGQHYLYRSTVNGANDTTATVRIPIDVRAKRRMDASDQLVAVFVNAGLAVSGAVSCGAALGVRILYKDS